MSGIAYRRDIDGLRSLAVIPVVLNHAGLSWLPGGFVGVDIFFVISGFLITSILLREIDAGKFSILRFYERRIRRILPALAVVILACFLAAWVFLLPGEFTDFAKSAVAALLSASNIWFWMSANDYFAADVATQMLLHTWSLAVEEQFYVLFPLLLFWMAPWKRRAKLACIGLITVASLLFSIAITQSHPTANFYLLPSRAWELGVGALLAMGLVPPARLQGLRDAASIAGLVLIALSITLIHETTPFPGLTALPPCLGAGLIIWAGQGGQGGQSLGGRLLSTGILVWFGLISYSLYLWHWPIMAGTRVLTGSVIMEPTAAAICIALSVLCGWASWRYVERPFRNSRDGFWQSPRRIFGYGFVAAALLLAASGLVLVSKGLPGRIEPQALALYDEATRTTQTERQCRSQMQDPCRLGTKDGEVDYVLWGDSHAGAYVPGFDAVLAQTGHSGVAFVKTACAPLPGLWRADQGIDHACDSHNAAVLDAIARDYPGATIVLAARWALMSNGSRPAGEGGPAAKLARTGESWGEEPGNAALMEQSLESLVSDLREGGHEVLIIGTLPEQGRDFARVAARSALVSLPWGQAQPVKRADHEARTEFSRALFAQLQQRYGVTTVDLTDFMCPDDCLVEQDGKPLYRDDDHISEFGAGWLLQEALLPRLADRAQP